MNRYRSAYFSILFVSCLMPIFITSVIYLFFSDVDFLYIKAQAPIVLMIILLNIMANIFPTMASYYIMTSSENNYIIYYILVTIISFVIFIISVINSSTFSVFSVHYTVIFSFSYLLFNILLWIYSINRNIKSHS